MNKVVEKLCNAELEEPRDWELGDFHVALYTQKKRDHDANQDSIGLMSDGEGVTIIAVADGVGGHAQGDVASKIAIEQVLSTVEKAAPSASYQAEILKAFEKANRKVLELNSGAATTLIVMELTKEWVRYYCAGDSALEVLGGRGKTKYRSVGHSSLDLAVEAGLVESHDAPVESDLRNTITNMVGSKDMRIEMGARYYLDSQDVVVMGSDGLFDNVITDEVLTGVKAKDSLKVCQALAADAQRQMYHPEQADADRYSKPDDISIAVAMRSRTG